MSSKDVVAVHERRGRRFAAAGVGSFVLDDGTGPAVVCMHGVPASSFLYRKVVTELAERGMRGVACFIFKLYIYSISNRFFYFKFR